MDHITSTYAKAVAAAVERAVNAVHDAPQPAPHGCEDDGYAIADHTSRAIAAMEREYV